jgi:hypothetical protein
MSTIYKLRYPSLKHHITTLQDDTAMQIKPSHVCANHPHEDKDFIVVKHLTDYISSTINDATKGKDVENSRDMQIYTH